MLLFQSLEVKFDKSSRTESASFDYVEIFYELYGKIYSLGRFGGTTISDQVVYVPSDKLWIYWKTDASRNEFYGFKIESIKKAAAYKELEGTISTLPSADAIKISGNDYPESEHSPYQNSAKKLWEYTSSESISSHVISQWVRVQDKDIAAAKEKAETAISKVTVMEGSIETMVKKGEFGTYMKQNYNSFLLGFNGSSKYIQITSREIGLYNGTINNSEKRAAFNENGSHFYRNGYKVGTIGTNTWSGHSTHRGLVFDLEPGGKYMAFAQKASDSDSSYTTMLCFSRSGSIYNEYGVHLGCDMYLHGNKIVSPKWETGYGITATINYVQVTGMKSDGTASSWGPDAKMVFKNGILMDIRYY